MFVFCLLCNSFRHSSHCDNVKRNHLERQYGFWRRNSDDGRLGVGAVAVGRDHIGPNEDQYPWYPMNSFSSCLSHCIGICIRYRLGQGPGSKSELGVCRRAQGWESLTLGLPLYSTPSDGKNMMPTTLNSMFNAWWMVQRSTHLIIMSNCSLIACQPGYVIIPPSLHTLSISLSLE